MKINKKQRWVLGIGCFLSVYMTVVAIDWFLPDPLPVFIFGSLGVILVLTTLFLIFQD